MTESPEAKRKTHHIYTVGHSNRSLREFVALLRCHGIDVLIDVRRWPRSRTFEHFNRENLEEALGREGISYAWLGESLGGFRRGGYENYMKGKTFRKGIEELLKEAEKGKPAIMCSESLWFKCHRRHIAEYLVYLQHEVSHILDTRRVYNHRMRSAEFVKMEDKKTRLRI